MELAKPSLTLTEFQNFTIESERILKRQRLERLLLRIEDDWAMAMNKITYMWGMEKNRDMDDLRDFVFIAMRNRLEAKALASYFKTK